MIEIFGEVAKNGFIEIIEKEKNNTYTHTFRLCKCERIISCAIEGASGNFNDFIYSYLVNICDPFWHVFQYITEWFNSRIDYTSIYYYEWVNHPNEIISIYMCCCWASLVMILWRFEMNNTNRYIENIHVDIVKCKWKCECILPHFY